MVAAAMILSSTGDDGDNVWTGGLGVQNLDGGMVFDIGQLYGMMLNFVQTSSSVKRCHGRLSGGVNGH